MLRIVADQGDLIFTPVTFNNPFINYALTPAHHNMGHVIFSIVEVFNFFPNDYASTRGRHHTISNDLKCTVVTSSQHGQCKSVKFTNVPSFLHSSELVVGCPELGELIFDVSYGGNFYAIVDVQKNFKGLENYSADKLITWARELRKNINAKYEFVHPEDPTINYCTHVLWAGAVIDQTSTARNAVFYGDKAIDRSPCGTGTSARMAQWYTKGLLKKGDEFIHESIIGSKFIGRIEEELSVDGKPAIKPSIEGWARIYGHNIISIDKDDDPYAYGFQVV